MHRNLGLVHLEEKCPAKAIEAFAKITPLALQQADIHYRGFSRMYRKSVHGPNLYPYQQVVKEPRG